jgi:N-methylhydantoinase B
VLGGFVGTEAAATLYGVAIVGRHVDEAATAQLRANRPETRAFHRNEYVDVIS